MMLIDAILTMYNAGHHRRKSNMYQHWIAAINAVAFCDVEEGASSWPCISKKDVDIRSLAK